MVAEKSELLKKRVLYIGSAVPLETADGLDSIQQPLRERYPMDDDNNIEGILSYITIMPSGIQLQYVSDPSRIVFFPITSLTLCAAVRCVTTTNASTGEKTHRFVSLSSPAAGGANVKRPAIFTAITRRTEGRKVLECHGFICSSSKDALELVQRTSFADRFMKGKLNGTTLNTTAHSDSLSQRGFETLSQKMYVPSTPTPAAAATAATSVLDENHPVRLVTSGDAHLHKAAPEFYDPTPMHGYFYKTRDSQIKTYAVERVTEGESERLRAVPPPTQNTTPRGLPSERRSMYAGPTTATLSRPTVIPIRAVPVVPPTATLVRPRFFSPPPPVLRPRPVPVHPGTMARDPYVFLPPPPQVINAPYVIRRRPNKQRGSDSSSRAGSSRSSSPPSPRDMNGERRRMPNGDNRDDSSDASRPRTPPTDYEHGPRVSRREQFDHRHGHLREVNGDYGTLPLFQPQYPYPYDYYVYPPRYPYAGYPSHMVERARSVPPHADRGKSKDRKKTKKGKDKKSSKKRIHGAPSDISTDSVGYTSEIGPAGDKSYPRMPRDFRRFENQYKHERAFSKSLAEEQRGGPISEQPNGTVYSLNESLARKGAHDTELNLY